MKTVVIDNHPLICQGIAGILTPEPDIEIVGQASCVQDAIKLLTDTQANLAFIDIKLKGENGLDIVRAGNKKGLDCKYIILTSSTNREDFRSANEEGVNAYILKEALPEEILMAVRLVRKGRKYFDPGIMDLLLKAEQGEPIEQLTKREKEVLTWLGKGLNNKDIAKKLFITEYTVKKHVSQILAKLELNGRTQAAVYAKTKGLA